MKREKKDNNAKQYKDKVKEHKKSREKIKTEERKQYN